MNQREALYRMVHNMDLAYPNMDKAWTDTLAYPEMDIETA